MHSVVLKTEILILELDQLWMYIMQDDCKMLIAIAEECSMHHWWWQVYLWWKDSLTRRSIQRAQTSLAEAYHSLHRLNQQGFVAAWQYALMNVGPWWKDSAKASNYNLHLYQDIH